MLGSLFLFLLSFAHGGEWHSIGAAPAPPYVPPYRVEYACEMRVDQGRGRLTKTDHRSFELHDADFRGYGRASFELEGQVVSLSFQKNDPEDRLQLTIFAKLGSVSSSAVHDGPLSGARGRQSLSGRSRSVTVTASCVRKD